MVKLLITQIIVICHQHEILQKIKNLILHTCGACAETFGMNQTTEVLPMNGPQLQINNMVFILLFENSFNKIGLSLRSSYIPKGEKIVDHLTSCQFLTREGEIRKTDKREKDQTDREITQIYRVFGREGHTESGSNLINF